MPKFGMFRFQVNSLCKLVPPTRQPTRLTSWATLVATVGVTSQHNMIKLLKSEILPKDADMNESIE